jgi:hypothetical protein
VEAVRPIQPRPIRVRSERGVVRVADTPTTAGRAARIDLLDEMAALEPELVVPGHRLPGTPADASGITSTRDYPLTGEREPR